MKIYLSLLFFVLAMSYGYAKTQNDAPFSSTTIKVLKPKEIARLLVSVPSRSMSTATLISVTPSSSKLNLTVCGANNNTCKTLDLPDDNGEKAVSQANIGSGLAFCEVQNRESKAVRNLSFTCKSTQPSQTKTEN